jgi:hypothetical protein
MASQMSVAPPYYRWTIEDGDPQTGTEDELIRQLSTGRLPPYVLVWREGWGEWLPAMQVEELAEAFPDVRTLGTRTARPSSIPGIPPVPVSDYPRLRHLAKAAPLGWPDGFEGPEQEIITAEVPPAIMLEAARVMTEPSPPIDLGLQRAMDRASRLPPEPLHLQREGDRTPSSRPALPLMAELGLETLIDDAPPRASWLRAHGLWVALVAIALGLGVTFGLRWVGAGGSFLRIGLLRPAEAPAPAAAAQPVALAAPEPPPPAPRGCHFRHPPLQLDDWAVVDVRPLILSLTGGDGAGGKSVALGYAQSHRSATGGSLDVESLRLTRQFWQQQDKQIFSVTPLEQAGAVSYHVERQGSSVAFGRALGTTPPLRVGMSDSGFALGPLEQRSQKLWDLPAGTMLTVPEVAVHSLGYTVATRASRGIGHVQVGVLDAKGQTRSPMVDLGESDRDYGRPALASGPEQTALAVIRRGQGTESDALLLGRAPNGQSPRVLERFEVPGPDASELLAPVIAPTSDGGFALMWSQGAGASRQVRLQQLSPTFEPLGPTFDVTSADPALGGATAATLHWTGDRLLAFYFVRRDEGHSLWAASVSCGA